jgi:hypothetical protein
MKKSAKKSARKSPHLKCDLCACVLDPKSGEATEVVIDVETLKTINLCQPCLYADSEAAKPVRKSRARKVR